ncbi:unnamed protein product [Arctogadus glacialis]
MEQNSFPSPECEGKSVPKATGALTDSGSLHSIPLLVSDHHCSHNALRTLLLVPGNYGPHSQRSFQVRTPLGHSQLVLEIAP